MASSGYFSKGGYVRTIFERLEDEEEHIDYQRIYTTIISKSPFLVTVGRDDIDEYIDEIEDKMGQSDNYQFDVDFVDAVALGGANRAKLEKAILNIQRDAKTLNYNCTVKIGETIYRLYPGSWNGKLDT